MSGGVCVLHSDHFASAPDPCLSVWGEDTWRTPGAMLPRFTGGRSMNILQGRCDAFLMTACTNSPLSVSQSWWLRLFSSLYCLTLGLGERVWKLTGRHLCHCFKMQRTAWNQTAMILQRESLKHLLPAAERWWNEVTYCSPVLRTVSAQSYYICSILIRLAKLLLNNSSD